ncbi:MAG: TonB-dependent receptor [Pelistega sp.]|nr:TonB-dependent receptor [Pelistega sp.]
MKFTRLHLALAATFVPVIAFAQEQVTELEPIVVTASRTAEPLKNVVGDVTVIDSTELKRETSPTLLGLLARKPGLQVYDSGGPQTVSAIYTRGANPQATLVMFNGLRINDSTAGGTLWNLLDPALLNRVEIIRGTASGLYGSNAMGGVINLITTPTETGPRDFSLFANIGGGSNGTFRSNAAISGATEKFDYYLAGGYATSDGFNASNTKNTYVYHPDKDGYDQASITGSFGYTFVPGHRLGVSFLNSVNRNEFDAGNDPWSVQDAYGYARQKAYGITSNNQITDWWESIIQISYGKLHSDNRTYGSKFENRTNFYSWQNNFNLAENQTLSLVYEHTKERAFNSSGLSQQKRHTNAVAALYKGDFNRHHIQANLRHDNVVGVKGSTTGGVSYAFDITPELQVGAGYSTGFRVGTFADMYSPLAWGFQGNPNLRPEKSRNVEFNLRYNSEDTQVGLTLFQTKYKDLINTYDCSTYPCSTSNVDKATIRGLSLDATQHLGNTTLSLGADFLNAKDDTTGNRLVRRANQVYRASVTHEFERMTVGADYLFVGHRYDDAANTKEKRLGGYGLVNLRADYKVAKNFQIQASVNNVFNKKYEPAYGYNGQGTNFFLNLSYQH